MKKNKKNVYAPKERGYLDEEPQTITAYSEKDSTYLPDPMTDPIVTNNISYMYFDYTYQEDDDDF